MILKINLLYDKIIYMEKKFISINNLDDCKEFLSNIKESLYVLNITIQNNNYDSIKHLINHSQKIRDKVKIINLNLPYEMLPKKDFESIYNLNMTLPNTTCNVIVNHRYIDDEYFTDKKGTVMWDIQTILKANKSIHEVCNFIKKNDFSPFEAYAYIHNYVSTIAKYNTTSIGCTWLSHDQFFPGAFLDLPEVVCMGYSSLEKEIIDNLNMPGLKCEIIAISFYNNDIHSKDNHARCLINVIDEKYGINQSCYEDATWDNIDPKIEKTPKYAHFAMNNNCHDRCTNDKYTYYYPSIFDFSKKNIKNLVDFNSYREFNKSINPISQLQIERAFFNVLVKSHPSVSFENLYSILTKMAKQSYKEQVFRRFKGNLIQEKPLLTPKMAKTIFNENHKNEQDSYMP